MALFTYLTVGRTTLSLDQGDDRWRLRFSGEVEMRDPSADLLPSLLAVHDALVAGSVMHFDLDFTALEFMNSGGLKMLISWIMKLKDMEPKARYTVSIIHDPDSVWQTSSLPVLRKLLPETISLERNPE